MKAVKEIGADVPEVPPAIEAAPAIEAPPEPVEIPMSLDEFCQNFSKTERRVVLLGAFHFEMKRQKRLKDTDSNYRAAFAAFITAPA
jgi:hypothetical protein